MAGGGLWRWRSQAPRGDVRLLIEPFRGDRIDGERLAATFAALHALLGARRSLALEVHLDRRRSGAPLAWFAVVCPRGLERHVEGALRRGYPNLRLRALGPLPVAELAGVALRRLEPPHAADAPLEAEVRIEPLLRAMAAAGAPATVRLVLRPAARLVERALSSAEEQIGPLVWARPVVFAADRRRAAAIASVLAAGPPRMAAQRASRPDRLRAVRSPWLLFRPAELARLWSLPAPEFSAVPCLRRAIPIAPAPPRIERAARGAGLLRDDDGPVTIAVALRRQHVAVAGAVEQGKTSFLVASVAEDLRRKRCAVIVLDPKGDAADAVLSIVPRERTCTLLDMAAPSAGFNPLAVAAEPDAIADHVVAALRSLFSEGEVRGSSDRYLRNALIAVLACGGEPTLWDVARLLEVGERGRAFRARVAERLIELPAYAELATFLADELPAQLADARATTTAKLDAPANKLARVLNSPAVKRILLNDSLRIDLDRVIERHEVLVVKGALGEVGAGNVAVLMQLLVGMLDAALGRAQDRREEAARGAVALKIDEAPLVINEEFARTLALKRSAGLETVACWQADAQWEPQLREQLDALFAHRVLFATASAPDARAASSLLLAEYSDQLRAGDEQLALLAAPDVRLHLPRHVALASWTTAHGRERPFIATTLPLARDRARIDWHARSQRARGGRPLTTLEPPAPLDPTPAAHRTEGPAGLASAPRAAAAEGAAQRALTDPLAGKAASMKATPPDDPDRRRPAVQSPPPAAPSPGAGVQSPPGHAELLAVDASHTVRWLAGGRPSRRPAPSEAERELLSWLIAARCALSSQIHRRFHPDRSLTTTQRTLKRLADDGLIARFQLHRDDGGGVPLCCAATAAGCALVGTRGRRPVELGDERLDALRRDVHVVGWLVAFEAAAGGSVGEVLGPRRALLAPPRDAEAVTEPPRDGPRPRGLLVSEPDGSRAPATRFAPLRPDAVVELIDPDGGRRDLLVVLDGATAAIEAADHLLTWWWRSLPRYRRQRRPPGVVVVCPDETAARSRAELADRLLTGRLAEIGVAPDRWLRPGREGIRFAVERDVHAGILTALSVPPLPPDLRAGARAAPVPVAILPSPRTRERAGPLPPWR